MNNKNLNEFLNTIIVYKGTPGKIITDVTFDKNYGVKTIYRFYPAGYGVYRRSDLEIIDENSEFTIANMVARKEFAIKEFMYSNTNNDIEDFIIINDKYQIIVSNNEYYVHFKYINTGRVYNTIEKALLGLIMYDKIGDDDYYLRHYVFKMLNMEE